MFIIKRHKHECERRSKKILPLLQIEGKIFNTSTFSPTQQSRKEKFQFSLRSKKERKAKCYRLKSFEQTMQHAVQQKAAEGNSLQGNFFFRMHSLCKCSQILHRSLFPPDKAHLNRFWRKASKVLSHLSFPNQTISKLT